MRSKKHYYLSLHAEPHKENQDTYYICPSKFGSGEGDAFFAVFDGHGESGHDCAHFAKTKLPVYLASSLKKQRAALNAARLREDPNASKLPNAFHPSNWPYLEKKVYEKCCRNAYVLCNKAMHEDKKVSGCCVCTLLRFISSKKYTFVLRQQVKDAMSGTTAISVGFHAGRMTISNVGDSRAVLGYRVQEESPTPAEEEKMEIGDETNTDLVNEVGKKVKPGDIVAIPLSEDQTPYRKDERDRLKKAGARICSIDQMEGLVPMHENWGEVDLGVDVDIEGDPPRVWCMNHNYPGTAFSRSLGDSVGEDLGVNAEPEIVTKDVTKGDEILVIASDGVFEFLTNQRVIDICAKSNDPLHACTSLLEASYEQWLNYELRTDDITCIVLFMKNCRDDDPDVVRSLMNAKQQVKKSSNKMIRELSMPDGVATGEEEEEVEVE
jgi:serine/threonine protein phosphatase PrpC